jgi:multicomponent K+:H+ antiporter subunit D
VAAAFVILTKVGTYSVLRLWPLLISAEAGTALQFGADALVYGGLATLAFGMIAMLASQQLRRLAAYSLVISSGTLLAAIGIGGANLIGGALYYLMGSTLASCALFLLVELIERARDIEPLPPLRADETDHLPFYLEQSETDEQTLDEGSLIGRAIPAATAFLGLAFAACALMIAGFPPLSGFLAKFAMLAAAFEPVRSAGAPIDSARWVLLALLLVSGLFVTIALSRAGVRHFWLPQTTPAPRLRVIECAPVPSRCFVTRA